MTFDYDVFFSYRHRPLDAEVTQKLFNMVESYRLPKSLKDKGYTQIRRAFRDTEELPVSRILTDTIDQALHSTNCLALICSLDTPSSEWVDREVETFIQMGRAEYIFPVLITGDPDSSFPPSLKLVPDVMDRLIDLRSEGNSVRKMMAKAETGILKVIASAAGCPEPELLREHKIRKNRAFIMKTAGSAAALAAVGLVSFGLMKRAQNYREIAQQREQASLSMIRELTYDLPDQLANVPGAYSKISDILYENTEDLNQIILLSKDQTAAEYEIAVNHERLATARNVLGSYDDALDAQEEAIRAFEKLAGSGYAGSEKSLASAYNNRGNILHAAGRYEEASSDFSEAISRMNSLQDEDPFLLAQMTFNAGANRVSCGDNAGAEEYFLSALDHLSGLEETPEVLEAKGQIHYNYGVLLYRSAKYDKAEEMLTASLDFYNRLSGQDPSLQNRSAKVKTQTIMAACLSDQGRYEEADRCYDELIEEAAALAEDTENIEYQLSLAQICNNRGQGYNSRGEYGPADQYFAMASEQYKKIYEKTNANADASVYAISLLNTGENAFKLQEYDRSKEQFEAGLEIYGKVCESLGDYDTAQYNAWLSYYELIHNRDYPAAMEAALRAYQLQPQNVLVCLDTAYACLYNGYYDDCDGLLQSMISLGEGMKKVIQGDLEAQQNAGMTDEHIPEVLKMLSS